MGKFHIIKKCYIEIETLPRTRLVHLSIGVVVVSFVMGICAGSIKKSFQTSRLQTEADQQKEERLNRFKSFLYKAEMGTDYSLSRY